MRQNIKILVALLIIALGALSFQKPMFDCSKYRRGLFSYHMYNRSGLGHWTHQEVLIVRNDSIQYEVSSMLPSDTTFFRITWKDECRYELRYLRATNGFVDTIFRKYMRKPDFKYSILDGTDKYYIEKRRKKLDTVWVRK